MLERIERLMKEFIQAMRRAQPIERISYGVAEAAEAIGIGETEMRRILNAQEIKSFRIGKRRLVRKSDLVQYVDGLWERDNGAQRAGQRAA